MQNSLPNLQDHTAEADTPTELSTSYNHTEEALHIRVLHPDFLQGADWNLSGDLGKDMAESKLESIETKLFPLSEM